MFCLGRMVGGVAAPPKLFQKGKERVPSRMGAGFLCLSA